MSEPTPLSVEELVDLEAGFGLAAAVMPEYIRAAKRVHVSKSEWLPDWWVGYGKDDGCQIEGTQNHWRWLAHLLLGLVADRDAPYSEDKPLDDPVARLFATIDAQATEIAALQAFKDYVHGRLDSAGISTHPDGPHSAAGCRIGDRLDIVLGEIAALKGALTGIVSAIDAHHPKYRYGPFTLTRTEVEAARRVLAGKEAQGD